MYTKDWRKKHKRYEDGILTIKAGGKKAVIESLEGKELVKCYTPKFFEPVIDSL